MKTITLTFGMHAPIYLKRYRFFDIGATHDYLDIACNRTETRRIAAEIYIPLTTMLERMLKRHEGRLRIAIYVSGIAMEQFRSYAPDVVKGLKRIANTGFAEFTGGTYSYSLSSLAGVEAFGHEVSRHAEMVRREFGQQPETFCNTALLYSDEIGYMASSLGYKTMFAGGSSNLLGWRSPGYIYANAANQRLKILPRNEQISVELHTAEIDSTEGEIINIVTDFHYGFVHGMTPAEWVYACESFIEQTLRTGTYNYALPRECARKHQPVGLLHADTPCAGEDGLTEWLGNELQQEAFAQLYARSGRVLSLSDRNYTHVWEFMQSLEHFERMSTRHPDSSSAYDTFINYMNILSDFARELEHSTAAKGMKFEHTHPKAVEYEYEFS